MSCKHDCPKPPLFPKLIFNRPALKKIQYRIGNYADVRAHLFDQLNKQPELSAWTHRGIDDPGIALFEADAVVIDILTFYQTHYANETYLRTAQWPQSITDLVRLTGYRLSPGVAGEATFALTIKGKLPVTVPMGPFAGIEGLFQRYIPARQRCQVLLATVGGELMVELPEDQVWSRSSSPTVPM